MSAHAERCEDHGSTLIELLIVVAIIAILAAIAVPNFLEAQTRAKVAHVMANMRSLAVAIEAYKTDINSYPRGGGGRGAQEPALLAANPPPDRGKPGPGRSMGVLAVAGAICARMSPSGIPRSPAGSS